MSLLHLMLIMLINNVQNTLVLYIVSSVFIFKFNRPCFYIFSFAFLTFCFPPSFPQMFWWFSRTNETYAFLPRVSWVGTSRISGRRFWGSWETLHAALETRARQYWCAFITFVYTLPVSKAGQVGDGVPSGDCCLWCWAWKIILKYLNLKCFQYWVSTEPPTHICLVHLWHAQLPVFLPPFVVVVMLSVWLQTFSRFFSTNSAAFLALFR